MLTSVHLVDGSVRSAFVALRRQPQPAQHRGLIDARVMIAAPFSGAKLPLPQPGRFGLVAFWEDHEALDAFLADHPIARQLAEGWSVRLQPQRAVPVAGGHWPALAADPPGRNTSDHDGPAAVLTIARTRPRRAVAFRRASAGAEAQIGEAPGLLWATGLVNLAQRVVATFSLWESAA